MTRATTAVCLLLALGALPASANAGISVQRGIKGIEIGMTYAEVVAWAGEPDDERIARAHIAGPVRMLTYGTQTGITRVELYASGDDRTVYSVTTTDTSERTSGRVGIGSHERTVQRRVPGARCRTRFGVRGCLVGELEPGSRVTNFVLSQRTRRVVRVTIGIVLD